MRRMLRRMTIVIAAAAASALLLAAPAVASTTEHAPARPVIAGVQDFSFESLDVQYTLGRADDGTSTLRVVETFVAEFPEIDQNRGMQRRIPERWLGIPTHPTILSVTDGAGQPRSYETDSEDDHLIITVRADEFVHGAQTYVFTYDMDNTVRFFSDTGVSEFYWDVNGVDWAQPFGRVSAELTVPAELAGGLTGATACYRGEQGSTETCEISPPVAGDGGAAVVVAATSALGPEQTMTVAVAFEPETFTPFDTSYLASPWAWLQMLAALIGLGGLAFAARAHRRWMRDEPGRPTIIAEYEPPRGIDALEAAWLLGKTTKAIPAEVLEQAVVGSIRIVERPAKRWGTAGYELQLIDTSRSDENGRALLYGLFGGDAGTPARTVFELGKADTRLSKTAQAILKAAEQSLVQKGLRRVVPGGARVWPPLITIGAAVLMFVFGILAIQGGANAILPVLSMVSGVALVFVSAALVARKPLTAHGAEVRDHLLGLKEFIEWAEADRIRMLQSPQGAERRPIAVDDPRQMLHLYETLLPFAVVFGQEKKWAEQLVVYYGDSQPGWYFGSGAFNAAAFSSSISSLSSSASSSASTSGGSSGGGAAGGGGGGGGGGGV